MKKQNMNYIPFLIIALIASLAFFGLAVKVFYDMAYDAGRRSTEVIGGEED